MTARLERRVVRVAIARFVAIVVTIVAVAAVYDQVVIRGLLLAAKEQADAVNKSTPTGRLRPRVADALGWTRVARALGERGRRRQVVHLLGPQHRPGTVWSLATRTQKEPIQPSPASPTSATSKETKNLVLAEMDRTKAWEREALLVVTSTSTGFVNEWAAESFEYLLHGDSAIITMQYSTLPSALGLLTARDQPPKVGRLSRRSRRGSPRCRRTSGRLYAVGSPSAPSAGRGFDCRTTCSPSSTARSGPGPRRSRTTGRP